MEVQMTRGHISVRASNFHPNHCTIDGMLSRFVLSVFAVLAGTGSALAHPHVWVEMQSSLVTNADGNITGLKVEWTFDDGYTQTAIEGLDADGDGTFSSTELMPLTKENINSLKEYDYFAVMHLKGEKLPISDVTEFGQVYANGKLKLYFSVPLKTSADPRSGEFTARVYDPEFFIAFDYTGDDAAALEGALPDGCKMELKPLQTSEESDQTLAMLAEKGQDWKPEQAEDFGAIFAQPVVVTCASS